MNHMNHMNSFHILEYPHRRHPAKPALVIAAILVLAGLLLSACSRAEVQESLRVGDKAPDFSLPAANGETVALADFIGKQPVLLYFHMAVG